MYFCWRYFTVIKEAFRLWISKVGFCSWLKHVEGDLLYCTVEGQGFEQRLWCWWWWWWVWWESPSSLLCSFCPNLRKVTNPGIWQGRIYFIVKFALIASTVSGNFPSSGPRAGVAVFFPRACTILTAPPKWRQSCVFGGRWVFVFAIWKQLRRAGSRWKGRGGERERFMGPKILPLPVK